MTEDLGIRMRGENWTYPRPGSEVEYVIGKSLSTRGER